MSDFEPDPKKRPAFEFYGPLGGMPIFLTWEQWASYAKELTLEVSKRLRKGYKND